MHKKAIRVTAAGRTDSGVHARAQVCHFDTELEIPENRFKNAINTFLPGDISIISSVYVDEKFHARFSAKRRVYKYYFTDITGYTVFNRFFCTQIRDIPDINIMNACAEKLKGIHDFTTFTSAGDKNESKIREIFSASFYKEGDLTVFQIEGNAFLWKMVRSIVGSILKYASLESGAAGFDEALISKDRQMAGTTAPSKGLFFHKIYY